MTKRIGILTSGGDCPGLNAAIRGVVKAASATMDVEIVGIKDGYKGLIYGDWQELPISKFSGILNLGGTILGTARTPFKDMRLVGEDHIDKVAAMKSNYKKMKLDCLVCLGGNGTHKTANMLSQEGLNIVALPKTIDNDIYGTEFTFGFHSAVEIATEVIDRVHTTAASHGRCLVVEIMGNKAGWLTLYSGVGGGADVILIPEIPYDINHVAEVVEKRASSGKAFSIIAVAEGAISKEEAKLNKKDRLALKAENPYRTVGHVIAEDLARLVGVEARAVVPGHMQRGGGPCAYDRILSTGFGTYAAKLIKNGTFGTTIALKNGATTHNLLADVAGKPSPVPMNNHVLLSAKALGINLGAEI